MELPTPNLPQHVRQRERQRLVYVDWALADVTRLVMGITDTAPSSLAIERAILDCGYAALRYQAALRALGAACRHD